MIPRFTSQLTQPILKQKGGGHQEGPALWNVVEREKASFSDYNYSATFQRLNGVWEYEDLNALLLDALNFYPGTKMTFSGGIFTVKNVEDRADSIAFLRTQSDSPVALPE